VAFEIVLKPAAQHDLDSLPKKEVQRIASRIALLANEPRPFGIQKLASQNAYRIRSGNYRILFEIDDHAAAVPSEYMPRL
jgi:mRNA interferase RelE/StbE